VHFAVPPSAYSGIFLGISLLFLRNNFVFFVEIVGAGRDLPLLLQINFPGCIIKPQGVPTGTLKLVLL
jgi:hypothetical protein